MGGNPRFHERSYQRFGKLISEATFKGAEDLICALNTADGQMIAEAGAHDGMVITKLRKQAVKERLLQIDHILWDEGASTIEMNSYLDL